MLQWYCREYDIAAADRSLIISAAGFDLTQKNLLAPLCVGGSVHFATATDYDEQAIIDCIHQQNIHRINCAPSAFYPLVQDHTQWYKLQSLRWLKFGGESIAIARLAPWLATQNQVTLVNMYGPTECTDISCTYTVPLPCEDAVIPIGFANDNVRLYVLDA